MKTKEEIIALLELYQTYKRYVQANEYAREFFDCREAAEPLDKYKAKMQLIECFIGFLEPSDEYTLLDLRYIKGLCVEECAECMDVSARTAYRWLDKAHNRLWNFINQKEG